jgi:predicted helicase
MFPVGADNVAICFSDAGSRTNYVVLAVKGIADLHFGSSIDAYQQVPRYRYEDGQRVDNITDWAHEQFRKHYRSAGGKRVRSIAKDDIFNYVYGVLHDPSYRAKYAFDLKRSFPRIPFRADFWYWADVGGALMQLHLDYETAVPFGFNRTDIVDTERRDNGLPPRCLLRSDREAGTILIDSQTTLNSVPAAAWDYQLGSRSAIDWVLDQYKESKPKDSTIREKLRPRGAQMTKPIARDLIYRRRRFDAEVIELCVRWYITYRLSYRDLVAMMAERGIAVSHTTIHML